MAGQGGGFVGVFDPTAHEHGGAFYQLWDVLGVQKEYGLSNDCKKVLPTALSEGHFIAADLQSSYPRLGKHVQHIYPCAESTQIIAKDAEGSVTIASHQFGGGRGVYLAGFEFGAEQNRLLQRAIWYASGREQEMMQTWFTSNIETEIAGYPETGQYVVINNSNSEQTTMVVANTGAQIEVTLPANGSLWFRFTEAVSATAI